MMFLAAYLNPTLTLGWTLCDLLEHDDGTFQVRDDAPLDSLLSSRALRRFGALMVVDAEGHLAGVITTEQVGRALRDSGRPARPS